METKEIYNLDLLVKIKVEDKELSKFKYREKSFFRNACFYLNDWPSFKFDELGEGLVMESYDRIFYKPCVTLYYANKHFKRYWFDTYKEALKFKDKIVKDKNFIE